MIEYSRTPIIPRICKEEHSPLTSLNMLLGNMITVKTQTEYTINYQHNMKCKP